MPATKPYPVRMESDLLRILREGVRRTPYKKQELIRITLRRYLPVVIEEEAVRPNKRVTNVEPWPKKVLEQAYKKVGAEWDELEARMVAAQGGVRFDD